MPEDHKYKCELARDFMTEDGFIVRVRDYDTGRYMPTQFFPDRKTAMNWAIDVERGQIEPVFPFRPRVN